MSDLPAEVWSLVIKHFEETEAKYKADLCSVARVNTNANTAASTHIYERARVADFDDFFYGYDHTPNAHRQPKSSWLASTTIIRASFSYYDLAPRMGPILARLLGDHNHHERLAELLPKLSELQLVSNLQTPLSDPSRQPPNERCWSPLSLPAKHICQTVHDSRKFPQVIPAKQAWSFVPNIDLSYDDESTVSDNSIVYGRPICNLPYVIYLSTHQWEWDSVRASVNEQIGPSILAQTSRAHMDRLKFKMYGMFFPKIDHKYICQCGDEEEHTHRVVNKIPFSIFKSRVGNRILYDIKYGSLDGAPTCMACGEK